MPADLDVAPRPRGRPHKNLLTSAAEPKPTTSSRYPRKPLRIISTKPRIRNRGMPPPATFDIDKLPDSGLLTERETGAAIRRPLSTLEFWRKDPEHPLKWRRVAGRVLYPVATVRAYLTGAKEN